MILVKDVTKSFDNNLVLEETSFSLNKGEKVAIVGPSGSGKTTFLRMVAGLDTPDHGQIDICGERATTKQTIAIPPHLRNLGIVFQTPSLWPHLTVSENIQFGILGLPRDQRKERLHTIMQEMDVLELADRFPETLSGGQQRRVSIARTLAPERPILLMDEPLVNLDKDSKHGVMQMLKTMVERRSLSLIYISHSEAEIENICDVKFQISNFRLKKV